MAEDDYVERATTLESDDAPQGYRLDNSETRQNHYRRLAVLNSRWNGKWRDEGQETTKGATAIVDAVAGQLGLTPYQKEEAHRHFSRLPDKYNQSYSTALLALCICGIVGRQDGRDYHPNISRTGASVDRAFSNLVDDIGVSYSALYRCWGSVEAEVFS